MNDEPKKEILSLLESPELREYLMAPPGSSTARSMPRSSAVHR